MLPSPARSHALLESSEPAEGARLTASPGEIVLRFTEAPERSLSSISVLDVTGAELTTGDPTSVPGDPSALREAVPELARGIYTINWRTVSRTDGHPSGGAFAFGIGVTPTAVPAAGAAFVTPKPSPLEMAGRLIIFLGLGLLVGAAWIGALAFPQVPPSVRRLAVWAWVAAAVGLVVLAFAQQRASGAGFSDFLPTNVGRSLLYRAGALAVAGAGLLAARLWEGPRRRALLLAGIGGAGAMLAHVAAGHAAARGDLALGKVAAQWIHFLAASVWLGGLAALLIGIRGKEDPTKATAVRRFSLVAGVALATVVVTGVIRSINEVGSWNALLTTGYGLLVVAKASLIIGLAGLGAINRFRNVPQADTSLRGLRKVSRGELVLAAGAVGAAAVLATLVPPATIPVEAGAAPGITVDGSDFATSVNAALDVSPGLPGPNAFRLEVTDFDSEDPIDAQLVTLNFSFAGGAQVEGSALDLEPKGDGVYQASGSNLSLGGPWEVTALVQQGSTSVDVPLEFATLCDALRIESEKANQPTVNTVDTPDGGSVEGYLIELGGDRYEVHFTFIAPDGKELPVQGSPSITAWQPGASAQTLEPIPLTRGHFIANATLAPGAWRFDGGAQSADGSSTGCFEEDLG
jgi:copper transport protein